MQANDSKSIDSRSEQKSRKKPVKENLTGKRIGRWTPYEHSRFLEALRIYGKDWTMIEMHVGTRDVKNIRAHAQKFLNKLERCMQQDGGDEPLQNTIWSSEIHQTCAAPANDEEQVNEEGLSNAQMYYDILKQKQHKSFSKAHKKATRKQRKLQNSVSKNSGDSPQQSSQERGSSSSEEELQTTIVVTKKRKSTTLAKRDCPKQGEVARMGACL